MYIDTHSDLKVSFTVSTMLVGFSIGDVFFDPPRDAAYAMPPVPNRTLKARYSFFIARPAIILA